MKTDWNYTQLANSYLKRPEYAPSALRSLFELTCLDRSSRVCDVGAGVAHLTLPLALVAQEVIAVEPNDAMRANGEKRTRDLPHVAWVEATAEKIPLPSSRFDVITFGSSFNVCNQPLALREAARLTRPAGWFACLWNHRDLSNPIQAQIESIIRSHVPDYSYGSRREDPTSVLEQSNLFSSIIPIRGSIPHFQSAEECLVAWRSHATLQRQAGPHYDKILLEITRFLNSLPDPIIEIPYTTVIWAAQFNI